MSDKFYLTTPTSISHFVIRIVRYHYELWVFISCFIIQPIARRASSFLEEKNCIYIKRAEVFKKQNRKNADLSIYLRL